MGDQGVVARMGSRTVRHVQSLERQAERERQPQRQRLERQLCFRWRAQLSSFLPSSSLLVGRGVLFTMSGVEWFSSSRVVGFDKLSLPPAYHLANPRHLLRDGNVLFIFE